MKLDQRGVIWVNTRRSRSLDSVMRLATRVGNGPLCILVTLIQLAVAGFGDPVGRQLAVGLLTNVTLYKILKGLIGRPRPFQQILVVQRGARVPDEFSFPSGHMAAACVMVVILGSAAPMLMLPLISLALLIGTSRVYLGMHYPSDVIAGAVLGITSGIVAMALT